MDHEEYFMSKFNHQPNRCYFSENIFVGDRSDESEPENHDGNRIVHHSMFSKKMLSDKYAPILHIPDTPKYKLENNLQPAQRWINYNKNVFTSFPIQSIKPKVQFLLSAKPGEIPREVEVERRIRKYAKNNIQAMLNSAGIEMWRLIPVHILQKLSTVSTDSYQPVFSNFPLEWFDDYEYDPMTIIDWLNIGLINGKRHPVPAKAFLPNDLMGPGDAHLSQVHTKNRRNHYFTWVTVSVNDYDYKKMRWNVRNLDSTKVYNIPRIYVMFMAENPYQFIERVKQALANREEAEKRLQFNRIVDCQILTGISVPSEKIIRKIYEAVAMTHLRKSKDIDYMEKLEGQLKLDYQRALASIELRHTIRMNPQDYSHVSLPNDKKFIKSLFRDLELENLVRISARKNVYKKATMYCIPEVYSAMYRVVYECDHVSAMLFYVMKIGKTASLADFVALQEYTIMTVLTYLNGTWIDTVAGLVCMSLRSTGKGCFNIYINDWTIFLRSKMYHFLELVKYRMQNALRNLVEISIKSYTDLLCKPCVCLIDISDEFTWGIDIINSQFLPRLTHVFYMFLEMNESGAYYSADPTDYKPLLLSLFDKPIFGAHFVQLINSRVMEKLVFAHDLYLSSVGFLEQQIVDARALIDRSYSKAIIPLIAYAKQYNKYKDLFVMDVKTYLKEFKLMDKSSQEYKEEISYHLRMKENLELTLPLSIQIGPFLINVMPLKTCLVTKRQELATKMIDQLTDKLKNETTHIDEDYSGIISKLSEKPLSIEQIFDIRHWIETLPDKIQELENTMKLKMFEYDILDGFYAALPNEDFNIKWQALAGPLKCYKQTLATKEMFEEETEKFLKQQISDLAMFDEKFEGLNMGVSKISSQYDTSKTTEISIDIKKMWKIITETKDLGLLLNKRQKLFEVPEINLEPICKLQDSFEPYKTLWVNGSDFLKWEEGWIQNPLPNIVIDNVRTAVNEYKTAILYCVTVFSELVKVQSVAKYFLARIERFEPVLKCMELIKNPDWAAFHWQELTKSTGLEIKFTLAMNFDYCMRNGIMEHYAVVKNISEAATRNRDEFEAKQEEEKRLKREAEEELLRKKNSRRRRKI